MTDTIEQLKIGDKVRYKPGYGTYGYEDMTENDGRVPAEVVGFTPTRVRVRLTSTRTARVVVRAVDAESLRTPIERVVRDPITAPITDNDTLAECPACGQTRQLSAEPGVLHVYIECDACRTLREGRHARTP